MSELACPDRDAVYNALLALLPQGRAWQTHDGSIAKEASVLKSFWYAVSGPVYDAELAICALYDEFFCATAVDDLDLWLEEYGLPDDCDPFGDSLCAKVQFNGGASLAYYEGLALALGYAVSMRWLKGDDAEFPGVVATLHMVIDSAASPSMSLSDFEDFGFEDALGLESLLCSFDRAIPAHAAITYEVV